MPGQVPAWLARSGTGALAGLPRGPAGPGLPHLLVPWRTLSGILAEPGQLSRLGPVTLQAARHLAALAARDPGTEWKVVITDERGQAIAVTRVRRSRPRSPGTGQRTAEQRHRAKLAPGYQGPQDHGQGLVSQVTLTVPAGLARDRASLQQSMGPATAIRAAAIRAAAAPAAAAPVPGRLDEILAAALAAAAQATARADAEAAEARPGGCAHRQESPGYRPPPRLREFVAARDRTCRLGPCRQPACRADLDHTIPHDPGLPT